MMGHLPQNHAKLMVEEDNGRFGNAQMTQYYKKADTVISRLIGNYEGWIWDNLDMEEIADISNWTLAVCRCSNFLHWCLAS